MNFYMAYLSLHTRDNLMHFGVPCLFRVRQNFDVPQYTSREPSDVLKDVEVGVRGQNKVSALAKDLTDKFSAKRKPPPPPQEPRPVSASSLFSLSLSHSRLGGGRVTAPIRSR